MMTRQEAINNLIVAWALNDQERCCSAAEFTKSDAEMRESLMTLGVTAEEIDSD